MADDIEAQLEAAHRREAALAGVLRAVADADGDLDAVLFGIARQAAILTGVENASVFRDAGDVVRLYTDGPNRTPSVRDFTGDETAAVNQVLDDRRTVVFDDQQATTDPEQATSRRVGHEYGIRTAAYVPVPAGGPAAGLAVFKPVVEPFDHKDIQMLEMFAVQAGNAITSAEMAHDIAARNAELAEALELQTATSEILELISANPGDLTTVLDGVLARAIELIGADQGAVMLRHGDLVRLEAGVGASVTGVGNDFRMVDGVGVVIFDEPTFFEDRQAELHDERLSEFFRRAGVRSSAGVPLKIDGQWIGQINLSRTEVRPFDEKQAAVLQTFADQAAIAIRNAGLFNDLEEALQLQTAMSEVLRLISAHPGDLDTVLAGVLERAVELCDGENGNINQVIGDSTVMIATHECPPEFLGFTFPTPSTYAQSRTEHTPFFIRDWQEFDLEGPIGPVIADMGLRSSVSAPLIQDGVAFGDIEVGRFEVRPFDAREARILQAFADQAVIAIGNAGLFNELEEALALQTATSEILELISANPGELGVVLDGVLDRAIGLIGAEFGAIQLLRGDMVRMEVARGGATTSVGSEIRYQDLDEVFPQEASFHDDRLAQDYSEVPWIAEFFERNGIRSSAQLPLRIDGRWIGQINLSRTEVRPFDEKQAAILQTFADQAAIAIRNAGLFNDLEEALQLQTATSEVLALISEHPGDLTTVLEGILENAARLCGGEAGSITMTEGDTTRYVASHGPAMAPYIGTSIGADVRVPRELFTVGASGVPQLEDMQQVGPDWPYFHELARVGARAQLCRSQTDARRGIGRRSAHVPPRGPALRRGRTESAGVLRRAGVTRHRQRQPLQRPRRRPRTPDRDDRRPRRGQHRP